MARHRKIDIRMWGDEKFCSLSAPPPCAQFLWIYLMSGPHTNSLPGLFVSGEAALAEALRWPLKGFREAFREVSQKGMAEADWKARLVWIPNAIRYNEPESPNVIVSWRYTWDETPECALKHKAHAVLHQHFTSRGEAFLKAFLKAFGEGGKKSTSVVLNTPSPIQEQEQEQDKDKEETPPPPLPSNLDTPEFRKAIDEWMRYRVQAHKKLTPIGLTRLLAKLASLGSARAVRAIYHSIAQGYQGVYEENGKHVNNFAGLEDFASGGSFDDS